MQQNKMPLKYLGYAIVCEEVPDEISLAFNVSGCPYHCEGCHSQYLWNYEGELLGQEIRGILNNIYELITCVCFLGGDQNIYELSSLCKMVKKEYGLKTCIYTGNDDKTIFIPLINHGYLDYLKLGKYEKDRGGLNNPNTNQRIYKCIRKDKQWHLLDITQYFWRKKE